MSGPIAVPLDSTGLHRWVLANLGWLAGDALDAQGLAIGSTNPDDRAEFWRQTGRVEAFQEVSGRLLGLVEELQAAELAAARVDHPPVTLERSGRVLIGAVDADDTGEDPETAVIEVALYKTTANDDGPEQVTISDASAARWPYSRTLVQLTWRQAEQLAALLADVCDAGRRRGWPTRLCAHADRDGEGMHVLGPGETCSEAHR